MRTLAGRSLALLFPDDCRLCAEPLLEFSRYPVCSRCLDGLQPLAAEFFCVRCRTPFLNPHPLDGDGVCRLCRSGANRFDAAYTFGPYDGPLRDLIHLYKFEGVRTLAAPLGRRLSQVFPRDGRFDALIPAPLHWWRQFRRGFNQSMLLARELSRRTGIPVVGALTRTRWSPPQAELTLAQRKRNLAGKIAARASAGVSGKRVLLIDDVFTTGATANACAAALKRAGAAHVTVLTLARTDRRWSITPEEFFDPEAFEPTPTAKGRTA